MDNTGQYSDFNYTSLDLTYVGLDNGGFNANRWTLTRGLVDANDSGVDMENGNPLDDTPECNDNDLLENEVMVDPWSSMESSNSPLTDSGPSGSSEACSPDASAAQPRDNSSSSKQNCNEKTENANAKASKPHADASSGNSSACQNSGVTQPGSSDKGNQSRRRRTDFTLDLDPLEDSIGPRKPHFLDEDYQPPPRSAVDTCKIPKPHFLDHSPSPDEYDERSDITNPNFLDEDAIDNNDIPYGRTTQVSSHTGTVSRVTERQHKVSDHFTRDRSEETHRSHYRTHLHYGLEHRGHSSERDKRTSQLYHGTWPGERDGWVGGQDTASVKSFSSAGSANAPQMSSLPRQATQLGTKMDCVYSLLSLLSLSPDNNADMSGPLLEMSQSLESCIAMRQSGCIPLLVQLIHSKFGRSTSLKAAQALHNIVHAQPDDKAGRREARVLRLLEHVREYSYMLEDIIEARKNTAGPVEDDMSKHPAQSVAALMKLSFDEEHRHVVCQLGGLQALAMLVSTDQSAHGSCIEDNTCVTMRKYAGMALTNLTFGDGNNKALLCSFKDFMLALVDQLQSPNDDMRQVTAAVLRNLSWRADSNSKQILREVNAVKGLTLAAMSCHKEATLKSVLSALWNLTAHCSLNKVDLCSVDGALGFLVDMLSFNAPSKTLAIVENSGGIMRNVSSHIAIREDYRAILRERNCLSVLLQHLKSPSLTVVSNSCGTLWNLSARCPQDQQYLWDHGAVPMLRSLIHSKHKMIAMGSSAALKNLLNSKPGKNHIVSLDSTARSMNLPILPTLGARKQKALEQEIDQNLAETCDNIEPATSPTTSNRDEKNLFSATERQLAMNLERHRMTSSSPLVGHLAAQASLSHSTHIVGYLSCSNTLLKGTHISKTAEVGKYENVNRSESKDSVTSTHSDSVYERVTRTAKVPIPTPRSKDIGKVERSIKDLKARSDREFMKRYSKDSTFIRFQTQPPIPPPRSATDLARNNYVESGYEIDHDSCDQPIDFSRKYSEAKSVEPIADITSVSDITRDSTEDSHSHKSKAIDIESSASKASKKYPQNDVPVNYGDYQETDLDQPTDYSLRYAEHHSETSSEISEPPGPSIHEDTIKHFCTEGTPYETPIIFSTSTSISDLRPVGASIIGRREQSEDKSQNQALPNVKINSEIMSQSDEKDTCSIEEPIKPDNDANSRTKNLNDSSAIPDNTLNGNIPFESKYSSGLGSPEKPVNYCDEGTPGYFSRVSSLSSLGEGGEELSLARKNAMATINVDSNNDSTRDMNVTKDKEVSKAVTFATEPVLTSTSQTPGLADLSSGTPPLATFVEETPLMFSRCSSLGSLSGCSIPDQPLDDQGSVVSEVSRLTSGCISPSEIPDSPGQSMPQSPGPGQMKQGESDAGSDKVMRGKNKGQVAGQGRLRSVFEDGVASFQVENTPLQFSTATSLSSLTIDDEPLNKAASLAQRASERAALDSDGSSESGGEKADVLAACINAGMQAKIKTRIPKPSPSRSIPVAAKAVSAKSAEVATSTPCADAPGIIMTPMADTCKTYFTEDTPALLSKAGSNSNLSVLSIETSQDIPADVQEHEIGQANSHHEVSESNDRFKSDEGANISSDSSNLSDNGKSMLAECIQMGISKVVKNAAKPDISVVTPNHYATDQYQSLPLYASSRDEEIRRYATEDTPLPSSARSRRSTLSDITVDDDAARISSVMSPPEPESSSEPSPPPPLPPKPSFSVGRPLSQTARLHSHLAHADRALDVAIQAGIARIRDRKQESRLPVKRTNAPAAEHHKNDILTRTDSLSSLSIDSFGSTDREIFEQCVRVGLSQAKVKSKPNDNAETSEKSRSVERLLDTDKSRSNRNHKSLDRSDKISNAQSSVKRDPEFEKLVALGVYALRTGKMRRKSETKGESAAVQIPKSGMTRTAYSYHGDTASQSLSYFSQKSSASSHHHSRPTHHSDGPTSLPLRTSQAFDSNRLNRSNSLSSLSGDSFGSTDKELFEQCVKSGIAKVKPRSKGTEDIHSKTVNKNFKMRSSDKQQKIMDRKSRDTHPSRGDKRLSREQESSIRALDKMTKTEEDLRDRAIIEEIISKGMANMKLKNQDKTKIESGERKTPRDPEFDRLVALGIQAINRNTKAPNEGVHLSVGDPNAGREIIPITQQPKNVKVPSVVADGSRSTTSSAPQAASDGESLAAVVQPVARAAPAFVRPLTPRNGSEGTHLDDTDGFGTSKLTPDAQNTFDHRESLFDRSNEYPALDCSALLNASIESDNKTDLDQSNESFANILNQSGFSLDVSSDINIEDNKLIPTNMSIINNDIALMARTLTQSTYQKLKFVEQTDQDFSHIDTASDTSSSSGKIGKSPKRNHDTWNDTSSTDITFPTVSGSVPMLSSFKSDFGDMSAAALPDLLEESLTTTKSSRRPDLTSKLDNVEYDYQFNLNDETPTNENIRMGVDANSFDNLVNCSVRNEKPLESMLTDDSSRLTSLTTSTVIEKEAAILAEKMKTSTFEFGSSLHQSVTSVHSLDLDNVKPPSQMGSLVSLTQSMSGQWDENSTGDRHPVLNKKITKSRKKSLPVALMVKRALTNSMSNYGSSENLDNSPLSILDNVKPPSEMDNLLDMESSMVSVASIVSEVADLKDKVLFDLQQPVTETSMLTNSVHLHNDLDNINPPSLFSLMTEPTLEFDYITSHDNFDDCISNTLNHIADIQSGSETCTPLQSDLSSVESTPKRSRRLLTPKEKRQMAKERYITYVIADEINSQSQEPTDTPIENGNSDAKSESESKSEEYVTARSSIRERKKLNPKQRRQEDRARYQTQTVNLSEMNLSGSSTEVETKTVSPNIEALKKRWEAKKTMRQKRNENAERFRTRTLADDIPQSPNYLTEFNFETAETTTGYESLSSTEFNQHRILDTGTRVIEDFHITQEDTIGVDLDCETISLLSNDDDSELNTRMLTYTKSYKGCLPVIESPTAANMCMVNNLKNLEKSASSGVDVSQMFASLRTEEVVTVHRLEITEPPSLDCEQNSGTESADLNCYHSDFEADLATPLKAKPKIVKPNEVERRDESLDSNGSCEMADQNLPKGIRGRRKAAYVSPYKRNASVPSKSPMRVAKSNVVPKILNAKVASNFTKVNQKSAQSKISITSRLPNAISSKKGIAAANTKQAQVKHMAQKAPLHLASTKPLPIERQGTFTKEEATTTPKPTIPVVSDKKQPNTSKMVRTGAINKPSVNTSPSRLPQPNRSNSAKPPLRKTLSHEPPVVRQKVTTAVPNRSSYPAMKNSPSNQSLQSNESTRTVTISSRAVSRHGSATSVNSTASTSRSAVKDVSSKIANLWKKVEQSKKQPSKPENRVWLNGSQDVSPEEPQATSTPSRLIRSSTFEGQPKASSPVVTAPKQKSSIAIRVSQIPNSRASQRSASMNSRSPEKVSTANGIARRTTGVKMFAKKPQLNGIAT